MCLTIHNHLQQTHTFFNLLKPASLPEAAGHFAWQIQQPELNVVVIRARMLVAVICMVLKIIRAGDDENERALLC